MSYPVKIRHENMTVVEVAGTWREMGRQYGELLKDEIWHVLAVASLKATATSDAFLLPDGLPMGLDFLDQMFAGVCEATGLGLEEMRRLVGIEVAYADELLHLLGGRAPGKCSALALFGCKTVDGGTLFGRNYDWIPQFSDLGLVLTVLHPADGGQTISFVNYPGCLYMTTGMNGSGLFMELNDGSFASSDADSKPLHNAWLLWEALKNARTAHQALSLLESLRPRNNYNIGIADAERCIFYEWGVAGSHVHEGDCGMGYMAMANHFVRPGWSNLPIAEEGGYVSSFSRREGLLRLAAAVPEHAGDIGALKRIFGRTVEQGGAKWAGTLFQVLAVPAERRMLIRDRRSEHWLEFKVV